MQVEKLLKIGHPILKTQSLPIVDFNAVRLDELIKELSLTMKERGGVGIAAPQIGELKRVFIYEVDANPRYPNQAPIPYTVIINPEIINYSADEDDFYEGCLSVPNLRGLVPRSTEIKIRAQNLNGSTYEKKVKGFEARIIQHETDHLNGILFLSRVRDISSLVYSEN